MRNFSAFWHGLAHKAFMLKPHNGDMPLVFQRLIQPTALGPFSVGLSLPQLITWGSVFYTFSLLMTPLEAKLGMGRAESSLAFSFALLA